MRKLPRKLLLSTFILALLSSTAFAQNQANMSTFTVGGNGLFLAAKRHMDNTGGPFVSAMYNFTPCWGIEALIASFNTHYKPDHEDDHRSINGTLFLVSAIYHVPPTIALPKLQPYAIAGVGIMGLNRNRSDANNEGSINAGIGLQYFLTPMISLRLEVRDIYTMVGGKQDFFAGGGVAFSLNPCRC